ncbi:MAG: hypothetical protein GTO18_16950 [Anaerolineales bacterium]|nr:hypothetical protein [Anaerolineales bacterium]
MRQRRNVWVAIVSLVVFTSACNLFGQIADDVEGQIQDTIEEEVQEAIETAVSEEMIEDLEGIVDQYSGENLDEMIEEFSEGEWTREDIPLPPDAEIFAAFTGVSDDDFVLFETSMGLDDAEAWMLESLERNGWEKSELQFPFGETRVFEFSKGNERLTLIMNTSPTSEGTTISISVT